MQEWYGKATHRIPDIVVSILSKKMAEEQLRSTLAEVPEEEFCSLRVLTEIPKPRSAFQNFLKGIGESLFKRATLRMNLKKAAQPFIGSTFSISFLDELTKPMGWKFYVLRQGRAVYGFPRQEEKFQIAACNATMYGVGDSRKPYAYEPQTSEQLMEVVYVLGKRI